MPCFQKDGHGTERAAFGRMRVFAITGPGLIAITLSVGALWSSIAAEAVIRHRAEARLSMILRNPGGRRSLNPVSRPVRPFRAARVIPG